MNTVETEIVIQDAEKYFTKLPVFADFQKITPNDLNLLSGTLQGDNPISMVLNLLRIIAANYSINLYDVSNSNPYFDKQFISPIYSKPNVPVSIIGMDIDADAFSESNRVFKIKPGIIILDFMAYTIPEFTVKASGTQGYIIARFSEEDYGENKAEFYNLDEDKFVQEFKNTQKIYKVKLFEVTVEKDSNGNPIPPQTLTNSLPLFSYQEITDKFVLKPIQSHTPLVMNPQYITTKDILGDYINLGNFNLIEKLLTLKDNPPETKFTENGVEYSILRDSLDFRDILKKGEIVRIEGEFYRRVLGVTKDTITLEKGLGMGKSEYQIDLQARKGVTVEKALTLQHTIQSKFLRWEIGDIKYKMDFKPTSPDFPFLGLFSPTRILNINNFPKLVPYMRNYRLTLPAMVGYADSNLKSYIFSQITRFGVQTLTRLVDNGNSNVLRIKLKSVDQSFVILKALLDDEITRKFIDPSDFTPRTVTIGENCVIRTPFIEAGLSDVEVQSAVETFANLSILNDLSVRAGTYSINTINVDRLELDIDVKSIPLKSPLSIDYDTMISKKKSYNDVVGGMSSEKVDITDDFVEFYPYRLQDQFSGNFNTKTINTVKHYAIPGNGFSPKIVNGRSSTGGIEHIIGAVNGWDRYTIPGFAYLYAGEYLGG